MKTAFYSLVLTSFIILSVRADLTIVYSTMVEPASQAQKAQATPGGIVTGANMTIRIKGDKARIDASPQMTAIFDGRTGELINLLNDQKTLIRFSPDKMRAIAGMLKTLATTNQAPTNRDLHLLARRKRSMVTIPSNIRMMDPILRRPIGSRRTIPMALPSWHNFNQSNLSFGTLRTQKCPTFAISQ